LRVPPCENDSRAIDTTWAPWRWATDSEPSVDPLSITTSSSSSPARRWARTAVSTSSSSGPPFNTGIATEINGQA
jgi:hypothetical protein